VLRLCGSSAGHLQAGVGVTSKSLLSKAADSRQQQVRSPHSELRSSAISRRGSSCRGASQAGQWRTPNAPEAESPTSAAPSRTSQGRKEHPWVAPTCRRLLPACRRPSKSVTDMPEDGTSAPPPVFHELSRAGGPWGETPRKGVSAGLGAIGVVDFFGT
jgi:hypothetical protein